LEKTLKIAGGLGLVGCGRVQVARGERRPFIGAVGCQPLTNTAVTVARDVSTVSTVISFGASWNLWKLPGFVLKIRAKPQSWIYYPGPSLTRCPFTIEIRKRRSVQGQG
jgi:hypothetical protein